MVNSDERQAIAVRLHRLDHEITLNDTTASAVDKLIRAVYGETPFAPIEYTAFNMSGIGIALADLIDPTCVVDSVDSTGGLLAYRLSCGDTAYVAHPALRPSYCPSCGARVVSGDGE